VRGQRRYEASRPDWRGDLQLIALLEVYLSEVVNAAHASAVNANVPPVRLVVSRTMTTPLPDASSTQLPPCALEKLDFRQSMPRLASRSLPMSHWLCRSQSEC
jgi:hypothetical protein